jgi:hypothetical protein
MTQEEVCRIKGNTSFSNMKNLARKGGGAYYPAMGRDSHELFRKGDIGDWKEYFSNKNLATINSIIEGKPSLYIRIGYFFFFTLRRKVGF